MNSEQRDYGARMFASLSNPSKLYIIECLAKRPMAVNEIAEATGLKQSMTSQHLSSLLSAGVVVYEKTGNSRIYSLRGPRIARIIELVEEFYEIHLDSLRHLLSSNKTNTEL